MVELKWIQWRIESVMYLIHFGMNNLHLYAWMQWPKCRAIFFRFSLQIWLFFFSWLCNKTVFSLNIEREIVCFSWLFNMHGIQFSNGSTSNDTDYNATHTNSLCIHWYCREIRANFFFLSSLYLTAAVMAMCFFSHFNPT